MSQYVYWEKESLDNIETAKILMEKDKYLEAAFFCNLACEKILKAVYNKHTDNIPPRIHNLIKLAKESNIYDKLSKINIDFLNRLEVFQIEGRYPTNREKLYHSTPREGFIEWIMKNILK